MADDDQHTCIKCQRVGRRGFTVYFDNDAGKLRHKCSNENACRVRMNTPIYLRKDLAR